MKDLNEVEQLANELIDKTYHVGNKSISIRTLGYTFQWDNAKRRMGVARLSRKVIGLSRPICKLNIDNDAEIKDTILHEIAHAIAYTLYKDNGHGDGWKRVAKQIGAKPTRCFDRSIKTPKKNYIAECSGCGRVFERYRRPGKGAACGKCCNGQYNSRYKLEFKKV